MAAEIAKHGGIAVCSPIAPYADARREVRSMLHPKDIFCLVHVSTPLSICERRDVKGLYAKARAGEIEGFTGVSDPYEPPVAPALTIDTTDELPEFSAGKVMEWLDEKTR